MEEHRNYFKTLTGKLAEKRSLRTPRRELMYNIRVVIKEMSVNTRS